MHHEKFKQSKFSRTEIDGMARALNSMRQAIEFQIAYFKNQMTRARTAAENCANTRGEFGISEGLGDKIVRSGVQSANALFEHAGSRHEHDGKVRFARANVSQNVQTEGAAQIQVE